MAPKSIACLVLLHSFVSGFDADRDAKLMNPVEDQAS